jgi:hypothetical protein
MLKVLAEVAKSGPCAGKNSEGKWRQFRWWGGGGGLRGFLKRRIKGRG